MHDLSLRLLWSAIGLFLLITIIYLSLTHSPPTADVPGFDKIGHFAGYLSLMLWYAWLYQRRWHSPLALAFILLGVAMEYVQAATGYRHFEYADMLADGAGVLVGWLLGGTRLAGALQALERRWLGP